MSRAVLLLAVVGAGIVALLWRGGSSSVGVVGAVQNVAEDVVGALTPGPWEPPARAAPYLPMVYAAEEAYGLPHNLLARVVYQETRFRLDIIGGDVVSSAGAVGIGQLMPEVSAAYGVDPRDPAQALPVAAQELQKTYQRFGSWRDAVASYNWGQGNWNAFLRTGKGAHGQERPQENIDYVAEIAADVGIA